MNLLSCCYIFVSISLVHAFSFTHGKATACDSFSVNWTGGQGPFQLLMSPVFGTPRNISIAANAQGQFTIPQFPFANAQQLLLTMSDATGFGSGGTSELITVGPSIGGGPCNPTDPGPAFTYSLNSNLQQCRPYTFSGYNQATQPVTIFGLIPSGEPFVLNPPTGLANFAWTADVAAGTSIIFVLVDARGRQGGASNIQVVGASADATCLNANSPSSTLGNPSPPATSTRSKTATHKASGTGTPGQASPAKRRTSPAMLAGLVVGGLVVCAMVAALVMFYIRKRRNESEFDRGAGDGMPFGRLDAKRHSQRLESNDNFFDHGQDQAHIQPYPLPPPAPASAPAAEPAQTQQYSNVPTQQYAQAPEQPYAPAPYAQNPYQPDAPPSVYPQTQYSQSTQSLSQKQRVSQQMLSNPFNPPPPESPLSSFSPHSPYDHYAVGAYGAPPPAPPQQQPYPQPLSQPYPPTQAYSPPPQTYSPPAPQSYAPPVSPAQSTAYHSHMGGGGSDGGSTTLSPAAQRKAEMAAAESASSASGHRPPRFVLHSDVEEVAPPNEDGFIQLPPHYSDRRAPIAAAPSQDVRGGGVAYPPPVAQRSRYAPPPPRSPSPTGLAYLSD